MKPGKGAQMVRAAGAFAQLLAREGAYAQIRLRSGEVRRILIECRATIGTVGNEETVCVNSESRCQALARYSSDRPRRCDEPC